MRRSKAGVACMVLGAALIFSALGLLVHNQREAARAAQAADVILPAVVEAIAQPEQADFIDPEQADAPAEMPAVEIDGEGYIGVLSIPALGLELPVMDDWSYPRLKTAPCRQFGAAEDGDLVIAGHNYARHFGHLRQLRAGDAVRFTDVTGAVYHYQVGAVEIVPPTATGEVKNSPWELVLYTCTYGGKNRVTVGCASA